MTSEYLTVPRLYVDADGTSRFDEVRLPLAGTAEFRHSKPFSVDRASVNATDGGWGLGRHPAPRRQLVITLRGRARIEAGSGESRVFGPGDVMLAEDTTGDGHLSVTLEGPRVLLFVSIPDDVELG